MLPRDYHLQLVTDHRFAAHREWPELIEQAVQGGVNVVQLRDKNASDESLITLGLQLKELLQLYQVPLLVNDRIEVAIAIQADGVHLGQSDYSYIEARKRLGQNKIIGLTINTIKQAQQADQTLVDYFGVGPVFQTSTKPDATQPLGLPGLKLISDELSKPVIAIGGIDFDNVTGLLANGADGVAVVSAICARPNPKKAAHQFTDALVVV